MSTRLTSAASGWQPCTPEDGLRAEASGCFTLLRRLGRLTGDGHSPCTSSMDPAPTAPTCLRFAPARPSCCGGGRSGGSGSGNGGGGHAAPNSSLSSSSPWLVSSDAYMSWSSWSALRCSPPCPAAPLFVADRNHSPRLIPPGLTLLSLCDALCRCKPCRLRNAGACASMASLPSASRPDSGAGRANGGAAGLLGGLKPSPCTVWQCRRSTWR